jgi:hypothetical protein
MSTVPDPKPAPVVVVPNQTLLQKLLPALLVIASVLAAYFGLDKVTPPEIPATPPAPPAQVIVIGPDGKPHLVEPAKPGTDPLVVPDEKNTGEITGPGMPLKIGSRCSFKLPDNVTDPLWELVPPRLDRALSDANHTLHLSTDLEGDYVVLAGGVRDSKPILWKFNFKILPYEKPLPTPAPPGPNPAPTPTPAPPTPAPSVPAPSVALQAAVAEVRAVMLKADAAKAAKFQAAWVDFGTALKVTPPFASISEFKASMTAFINAVAIQGDLAGAFPGYSAAAEQAFVAVLGSEDGALDMTQAQAYVQALAWACSR